MYTCEKVIITGSGFTGHYAAKELKITGMDYILLETRDSIFALLNLEHVIRNDGLCILKGPYFAGRANVKK